MEINNRRENASGRVLEIDELSEHLLNLHEKLGSWAKVADELDLNKGLLWKVANTDYEPKGNSIRAKLGLSMQMETNARRCKCGRVYVPNVPWRHHCFVCRPPRRKAGE